MRFATLLPAVLALLSCHDEPTPDTSSAELEEFCQIDGATEDPAERCGPLLVCVSSTFYDDKMGDFEKVLPGHCAATCGVDEDCHGGQICVEGACLYACVSVECPHDWLACMTTVDGRKGCLGHP